jgi:hypothetical protein
MKVDKKEEDVLTLDSTNSYDQVLKFQIHVEHAKMSIFMGYSRNQDQEWTIRGKNVNPICILYL